jgi:hypothetical protein
MLRRKFNRFAAYELDDQLEDFAEAIFDTVDADKGMSSAIRNIFSAYNDFRQTMYAEEQDFYYFSLAIDKFLRMKKNIDFTNKGLDEVEKNFSKVLPIVEKFASIRKELNVAFQHLDDWSMQLDRTFDHNTAEKIGNGLLAEIKKIRS